jgi:ferritin
MELTKKLTDAFNTQINAEMWSSNLYLAMSVYFMETALEGCAKWMKKQSEEEITHAHKLIDYAVKRGGKVIINRIDIVPHEWESPKDVFEKVYKHECYVSEMIDKLMDVAIEEDDKATQEFLRWFIKEQIEEEENAKTILDKINLFGNNTLYGIDNELKNRK